MDEHSRHATGRARKSRGKKLEQTRKDTSGYSRTEQGKGVVEDQEELNCVPNCVQNCCIRPRTRSSPAQEIHSIVVWLDTPPPSHLCEHARYVKQHGKSNAHG